MSTIKYDAIPTDAIITIKLSGAFYDKLKVSLLSICSTVEPQELLTLLEKFKTKGPADDATEHNIHTLLMLIREIENSAKTQGLTQEKEMVIPEV